ncbi:MULTISPECIES: hypothetical protein [Methylosinus]|uniref:hypothetical protein n=1 Tax=Methylosinus TaxID=425 RepID=UPI0012DF250D|nr:MULTISPECIES: hypothetical protein [Methylosinus]
MAGSVTSAFGWARAAARGRTVSAATGDAGSASRLDCDWLGCAWGTAGAGVAWGAAGAGVVAVDRSGAADG